MLRRVLGSLPKSRTFDVDPYVIEGRITQGKVYGILPLAASQLEDDGTFPFEHFGVPLPLYRVILEDEALSGGGVKHISRLGLEKTSESLVLLEFS